YDGFCLVDPLFYDSPMVARDDDVDFDIAASGPPSGWKRDEFEDWLVYTPESCDVPTQGWKIHASASLDHAEKILASVWDYCVPRGIPFKFVRSKQLLLLANGKYAHRGSSGKFVTIYPVESTPLETILTELGAALAGLDGPYILSDLRWEDGPLYVRYGAFAERYCVGPDGEPIPAIEDASGELVPDRRGATFHTPPWVPLPEFLQPQLDARTSTTVEEMPYQVERPLHFSNGGGVYAATDRRTGEAVVLKEARPHAGLAVDGSDAVARLRHERIMLDRLTGLDVVPAVRDYFTLGGHDFLVLEFIDAVVLNTMLVDRYPLALLGDDLPFDEYTAWALQLQGRVEDAIAAVHARGVVVGDLHPQNILVRPDGRIALIDLEIASDVEDGQRPTLGDPAFSSPGDRTGFDIDLYALACLRLFLFFPLTELIALDAAKAAAFGADVVELFPVPAEFVQAAVQVITGADTAAAATDLAARSSPEATLDPDPASWPRLRDSMARAILASATPERDDRLFPGDIKQFETGGLNLAHGAAGVLHALHMTGAGRHPDHEEWLVRHAMDPPPGTRLGFYDGLHGVAYALDGLGRRDDALRVLELCAGELDVQKEQLGPDLYGGLAGIGLNLAHFAEITGETAMWDTSLELAEIIADELPDDSEVATVSGGEHPYAGLLRGSSGPALLFLRLYDRFGDDQLLDLAATALRHDLRRCVIRDDGALEVNEGFRTMPYLWDGSIGIGLVLDDYLARRDDQQFSTASAATRIAAHSQFYIESGLFSGRAGMILALSRQAAPGTAAADPMVAGHIRRLGWHAVTYKGDLAFPGDQLLRLSMDLATGTAGVLLAVGAAMHDQRVHLPFLGPSMRTGLRSPRGGE
ncbi:MAG: class III lanthionine synthetase LanKC, partial [Actinomycetes bacterium]